MQLGRQSKHLLAFIQQTYFSLSKLPIQAFRATTPFSVPEKCISESEEFTSVGLGWGVKFTSELLNRAAAAAGSRCSGCPAACTGT